MHPLLAATYEDKRFEVARLLEEGLDLDTIRDEWGRTALMTAAQQGHCNLVLMLIRSGASTQIKDNTGCTALVLAVKAGHRLIVDILVEIEHVNHTLRRAASTGAADVLRRCLELQGANINARDTEGRTALMLGAMGGHRDVVIHLVEQRANYDARDRNGHTALMLAAQYGHHEVAEFLAVAPAFSCGIVSAAVAGYADIVDMVMEKAAVDAEEVRLAFMLSSYKGFDAVVKTFIEKGVDVDMYAHNCKTALHTACELGHLGVVKVLVEKGAKVDIYSLEGNITPLMLAAHHGHREIVRYLISKGAQVDTKDGAEKTAMSYATDRYIIQMLLRARNELRRRSVEERRAARPIPPLPFSKAQVHAEKDGAAGARKARAESDMQVVDVVGTCDKAEPDVQTDVAGSHDKAETGIQVDVAGSHDKTESDMQVDVAGPRDKAETDIQTGVTGPHDKAEADIQTSVTGPYDKAESDNHKDVKAENCEVEEEVVDESDCPICFLQVSACDASPTPCSHPSRFHNECLLRWKDTCRGKGREPTCPLCDVHL